MAMSITADLLHFALETALCFLDDHPGQQQQADQVGECHQSIKNIGNRPHQVQRHNGTQHAEQGVDQAVRFDDL